jgi:hypothetical protein
LSAGEKIYTLLSHRTGLCIDPHLAQVLWVALWSCPTCAFKAILASVRSSLFFGMSIKYKFNDSEALYFVTFSVVGWVDVFTRNVYKDLL